MPVRLDTKGLNCPIPILRVKKALMRLESNDTLLVETTDPGSVIDLKVFCRAKGHELMSNSEENGVFKFEIRKST
ncbi:MAG: sulfurtransferase TusA family protein [Rhodospirillales bacterium]|nr:sulfurtransferase TusA family protein [Rhodospirillales bacterium]MDP7424898.1 sulfurtransferase TusA family protein [Rhodospirillales bacterium]